MSVRTGVLPMLSLELSLYHVYRNPLPGPPVTDGSTAPSGIVSQVLLISVEVIVTGVMVRSKACLLSQVSQV